MEKIEEKRYSSFKDRLLNWYHLSSLQSSSCQCCILPKIDICDNRRSFPSLKIILIVPQIMVKFRPPMDFCDRGPCQSAGFRAPAGRRRTRPSALRSLIPAPAGRRPSARARWSPTSARPAAWAGSGGGGVHRRRQGQAEGFTTFRSASSREMEEPGQGVGAGEGGLAALDGDGLAAQLVVAVGHAGAAQGVGDQVQPVAEDPVGGPDDGGVDVEAVADELHAGPGCHSAAPMMPGARWRKEGIPL